MQYNWRHAITDRKLYAVTKTTIVMLFYIQTKKLLRPTYLLFSMDWAAGQSIFPTNNCIVIPAPNSGWSIIQTLLKQQSQLVDLAMFHLMEIWGSSAKITAFFLQKKLHKRYSLAAILILTTSVLWYLCCLYVCTPLLTQNTHTACRSLLSQLKTPHHYYHHGFSTASYVGVSPNASTLSYSLANVFDFSHHFDINKFLHKSWYPL